MSHYHPHRCLPGPEEDKSRQVQVVDLMEELHVSPRSILIPAPGGKLGWTHKEGG